MLRLALLGGFQVRDPAGREIIVPGTKAVLLLAYLALCPGQSHSRDKLMSLLWSDRGESQARGSLRQAIWSVRRALERIEPCPLVVKGETLGLDPDAIETDVHTLEQLVAEGSADALSSAVELYRGPVLEGLRVRDSAFEAFVRSEQERIHDLVMDAYTRLLEGHRGKESDESVAAMARSLLKIDPLQEVAHQSLIRHYAGKGQMAVAVRQYQSCCDLLRQELDVEPSAETQLLIETIKRARSCSVGVTKSVEGVDAEDGDLARPFPLAREKPTIAVLPFLNLSGDPEQEYFSDGLTEDIINALALWRSFPVIARNSSFVYKGKAVDVKQIGRELAASYVLEGSVRKYGSRVRITAQLVDTATALHVWVDKFDRDLEDVFDLQDEITERIAATLELTLGKVELMRSKAKRPRNLHAWDFCLRGRSCLQEWTKEGTTKAREMFERAIELDPNYSEAFADLAWTDSRDLLLECTDDRPGSMTKMYEAARRAVELDDASWRARYRLSSAYIWRNEHDLAIAEGRRAVELNPMNAVARHALGNKLDLVGDPEGIPMMEQAQKLNPQDPQMNMHLTFLARAYLNARQYERSVECARKAIQRQPGYPNAYHILAIALGHMGDKAGAREAFDECERLRPGFARRRSDWRPYLNADSNEHLQEGLHKAGLRE
jgi:TolB-like protein/DNA-binding SARP family transcriptional activator/Tfp pilus assembly protein PilF